jgi:hypothetical protein
LKIINAIVPLLGGGAFQYLKFLHNGDVYLVFKKFLPSKYGITKKNKLKQQNFMHGKDIMGGCY